jgi:hypothetical protein
MGKRWTEMQEHLGKQIINIGNEVLEENLHIEMGLSSMNDKGKKVLLVLAGNARWDKRGNAGRKKDSLGCSVFSGGNFSKVNMGLEPKLQTCIKCSSKGMEHELSIYCLKT